jgi:hypothetical protein
MNLSIYQSGTGIESLEDIFLALVTQQELKVRTPICVIYMLSTAPPQHTNLGDRIHIEKK